MVKFKPLIWILIVCTTNLLFAQEQKTFECKATYYHNMFENRRTSSGEIFSQKKYTAAHKTLPLHTLVKVTNLKNGRSVFVKVNDRCPKRGVIDLSYKAAKHILLNETGSARVKVEIVDKDYLEIIDDQDEIFALLDQENLKDTIRNNTFDSIITSRVNEYEVAFIFPFYVQLCAIENIEDLDSIIEQLPINYKNNTKAEKVLDEDFYYVNIGPFSSINLAEQALKGVKNTFKSAYIVKKK